MSVRRALVDCVVLSLQDACLYYPCCKRCFSRIDIEQQNVARCSKCGHICRQVDHRYRLSMRVARDKCIFGVTVFGTCLNTFFGIHASGLQRLVDNLDGPVGASTRSTLLVKAAKDCFIGRHFIFGIKLTGTETKPWLGGHVVNGFGSKDTVQFIATQMILPNATGLRGCTVASYYRILLQKAAEYELGSTDPTKISRPPETTLLLIPHHSPASSFNSSTLSASGLLSQSLQSSQYQDCTLTPTPPWQQSLGLVTSSAEQEEGCSTQDSEEENRQTDNNKTPHHEQIRILENHEVTEERALSPLLSPECTSYNSLSFAKYPCSSIENAVRDSPILKTWFSPSSPVHNSSRAKRLSTRQLTETSLSSSLAWEDLPFSESLTEFVCEENKDFDIVSESEPHLNVQNQKETARINLEVRSQDKNISTESASVWNTRITDTHSQILLEITNTPAPNGRDRHDLSDQVNRSQAINMEYNQEGEKAAAWSFENEEGEQLEGDTYNCSADLFSSSLMIEPNTNTLNTHAGTIGAATECFPLLSTPDKQHPRREKGNVPYSTSDKQKPKGNNCITRDPPGTHELDFIPPSQSTPIVKVAAATGSPASSYRALALVEFSSDSHRDSCAFHGNLSELDSKKPAKITSSLCKCNCVSANQCGRESTKEILVWSATSGRHSHRFTPKRRFWKPDKHNNRLLAQQHLRVQEGDLNTGSTRRINHRCDSSDCYVTVCDYEDNKGVLVPPTPAAKTRVGVKLRRRGRTENSSSRWGYTQEGQQEDGVKSKRTLLDQSQRGPAQTGNGGRDADDEGTLGGSNCCLLDDENEACDWSRDLFSDSI